MVETTNFQRFSIDLGIDLGTTNSAVAVCLGGEVSTLRNSHNQELTPSAVRVRPNGAVDVGQLAYQRLGINPDEVAIEFKRWLASDETFHFPSGRSMSAVELSAEVLKSLLDTAELRLGRRPVAAVITVPAAFDLNQCARTEAAARSAGLQHTVLLQEPVAASLAYGFSAELRDGAWLVFDLGGGTLDVALVGVRDSRLEVLDHEGDNFLGGKDLDWAIVEKLVIPRLAEQFQVGSWRRDNPARKAELAMLKHLAEDAKIRLSTAEEAVISVESGRVALTDDRGDEVSMDVTVRRSELETLCEPWLTTAIAVTERLVKRNAAASPRSILFVGGPTSMPIVRRRVAEALSLEVVQGPNPMLAVAEGAAVFAASQPLPGDLRRRVGQEPVVSSTGGPVQVVVSHVNVTDDHEVPVGVRVHSAYASEIEVVAADGSWRSGRLRVNSEGAVVAPVALMREGRNEFRVQAYAEDGQQLSLAGETFVVTKGLVAAPPPLSRSIGVVVIDPVGAGRNVVETLLEKGTPLPARATYEFRTTIALEPGGDIETISVYLVEGESRRPERNRKIGHIDITDRDVPRALPAGSPLEIRLDVSSSRLLTAEVFLPVTDQSFKIAVNLEPDRLPVAELSRDLMSAQQRYESALPFLSAADAKVVGRRLEETASLVRSASAGDPDAQQKCIGALKEIHAKLDEADARTESERTFKDAEQALEMLQTVAQDLGNDDDRRRATELAQKIEIARRGGSVEEVDRLTVLAHRQVFEILGRNDWFWEKMLNDLAKSGGPWKDPVEAQRLIREGRSAAMRGDGGGLRRAAIHLWQLQVEEAQTAMAFVNVGIRRR